MRTGTRRGLLIGLASILPAVPMAGAQEIQITQSELEGKSEPCLTLAETVANRPQPIEVVPPEEIVTAINEDRPQECGALSEALARAPTGPASDPNGGQADPRRSQSHQTGE